IRDRSGKEVVRLNLPDVGSIEIRDEYNDAKDKAADPNRVAAERLLAAGGYTLTVTTADGKLVTATRLAELPLGGFPLNEIVKSPDAPFGDDDLKRLVDLPGLVSLHLVRPTFTDAGLAALAKMKGPLRDLAFVWAGIGDEGVKWIARVPGLTALGLG